MNDNYNNFDDSVQNNIENSIENSIEDSAGNCVEDCTEDCLQNNIGDSVALFDERKAKKSFLCIGFGFAIFTAISFLVATIISAIALVVNKELFSSIWFVNLLSPISLYLFALPVLLLILSNVDAEPPRKRRFGFGKWCLYFLVGFGLMYIGSYIGNGVMSYLSALTGIDYQNGLNSLIDFNNLNNLWVTAIFTVIVAPIGEEFIFRKLIIDRTQKYGGFCSIFLSALIFGLMHGNFYQFFYAFALGLVLGYMYYSTGKLYLTILFHAAVNFFGSIVTVLLTDGLYTLDTADINAFLVFISENIIQIVLLMLFLLFNFICMTCAIVLPIVLRKHIVLQKGICPIPREKVRSTIIFNAGIIVMVIVYISQIIISLLPA